MFLCNSKMAKGLGGQFLSLLKWGKWAILLLMLTLCLMVLNTEHKKLLWIIVPTGVFHLMLIGEKMYAHYFIPLFPLLVLYVLMLFLQRNKTVLILAIAILCLSHRPLPRMAVLNLFDSAKALGVRPIVDRQPIPEEEKNSVWNYSVDPWRPGSPLAWLVNHDVVQCNRKTDRLDKLVKEVDFKDVNPIWVVSYGNEFESDSLSVGYALVDSVAAEGYSVWFYRRQ